MVAESAQVIGDVVIGEESSIWFNAVVRGDVNYHGLVVGWYKNRGPEGPGSHGHYAFRDSSGFWCCCDSPSFLSDEGFVRFLYLRGEVIVYPLVLLPSPLLGENFIVSLKSMMFTPFISPKYFNEAGSGEEPVIALAVLVFRPASC